MTESSNNVVPAGKPTTTINPDDVDALRRVLDLMENFSSNDQRARYLLSSNWMRERLTRWSSGDIIAALELRLREARA